MQIASTYAEQVRHNSELPEHLRQSCVLLRFAAPIRSHRTGEFLRIHLTPGLMRDVARYFEMRQESSGRDPVRLSLAPVH